MQDNTNFNIMGGFVQGTESLIYRMLSHVTQILDSRCVYFIFSLMRRLMKHPEICILYIFIMHFLIKFLVLTEAST